MKKSNRILLLLLFVLLGAGCGKEENEEQTEITLLHGWGTMEDDHQVMRQIYQDFEKENPDIRLNMISMPSSEKAIAKAREMLAVGKTPDLIFTGGEGKDNLYSFMVNYGYALDLMPYLEEDSELLESVSPSILKHWVNEKGELYTVSDVLLVSGYWYNKKIFNNAGITEVPSTWEDFFECCRKIQEWAKKEKLSTIPIHLDGDTSMYLIDAFMQVEEENAVGRNEEQELTEALGMLNNLKTMASVEEDSYTYRDRMRSFNIGHSAICVNGVWAQQMIHPNLDAGYALFPSKDGQGIGMVSACTGYLAGNSGDTEKEEACIRFIKYMLSEPVQKRILRETGQIPSNPQVGLNEVSKDQPDLYQAYHVVMEAETFLEIPANRWNSTWIDEFNKNIGKMLKDEMSKEEFLEELQNVNK